MLCALVWYRSRSADVSPSRRASGREIWRAFLIALPALLLPFVIRGAVIEGVATATEVSTIGIAYSFLIGVLVYREFQWSRLGGVLIQSASLSGAILIVVGAATAMPNVELLAPWKGAQYRDAAMRKVREFFVANLPREPA